ncbi:MAG: hypothetical protein ACM31C_07925 [Acidobacteriota bacterium]
MASESTAIVELISLVNQKPVPRLSDEDLLFAPTVVSPPRRARTVRAHGFEDEMVTHRVARGHDLVKPLFAATLAVSSLAAFMLTVRLTRKAPVAPAAAATVPVASVLAAAMPPLPVPAPAAPIIVQPIVEAPAPPPKPALVELALESTPAGAQVTLVDRGNSTIAGTTPLSLSVDPSREYDVVFTLAGHPTKLAHLDPHATTHLAIDLAPAQVVEDEPAPPRRHHAHAHARAQARAAAIAPKATGTLMVSSKPPCAIAIDGKPTGMTTPQRSIALPAGSHHVTLTNEQQHVKKTYSFAITPNHATKLIRDLMKP